MFLAHSEDERNHAKVLMDYQNKRGGRIIFKDISKPNQDTWGSAIEAIDVAINLEKKVNESLLNLHKLAEDKSDPHLGDFIEGTFLGEQVDGLKALGDLRTKTAKAGEGLGLIIIDQELQKQPEL